MPATFTIIVADRLVRSRAWGTLTDDDLRATQRAVRDDRNFAADFRQIYDFTQVEQIALTAGGLRDLARRSPFDPAAQRAIVVRTSEAYGLARMYEIAGERDPACFRIFCDVADAEAWLAGRT